MDLAPPDLDAAARTVWGEARGEPYDGRVAVAWVIRNRVDNPSWWGRTVKDVCFHPKQFSCWNDDDPNRPKCLAVSDEDLASFFEIVRAVFDGEIPDPTGGADHYERVGTGAGWARNREFSTIIGKHAFYKIGV